MAARARSERCPICDINIGSRNGRWLIDHVFKEHASYGHEDLSDSDLTKLASVDFPLFICDCPLQPAQHEIRRAERKYDSARAAGSGPHAARIRPPAP